MQVFKFLVVDDASFIRDLLKKQLRDAFPGAQITDVASAVRAQAALKTQNFDLILCDWEMPEMSGEEFLRWLRAHEQYGKMPFIMVTSRGERDFIVKAVQAGVNDYLGKPFKPETLIAKVSKVLRAAGKKLAPGIGAPAAPAMGGSAALLTGRPPPAAPAPSPAAALPAAFQGGSAALLGAAPPARTPPKVVARGQAQLNFAQFTAQCVIKDISLQTMSGIVKREAHLPAIFEPVVISIVEGEGESVARLNGYVHGIQSAENRIDASVLKVTIRFVDDDPVKLDHLSRYIEKL